MVPFLTMVQLHLLNSPKAGPVSCNQSFGALNSSLYRSLDWHQGRLRVQKSLVKTPAWLLECFVICVDIVASLIKYATDGAMASFRATQSLEVFWTPCLGVSGHI